MMLLLAGAGCPPQGVTPAAATAATAPPDEMALGQGDVFDVRVFSQPDLTGTYRVDQDGMIDFPLVGRLHVAGKEPHDVAKLLEQKLGQNYLRQPQVSVFVQQQNSKRIVVLGQVQKPGNYPYTANMTVIEAISAAGGFNPLASKNKSTLTRTDPATGAQTVIEVPLGDIGEGKAPNVPLRPGDIVSVPERLF